MRASLLVALGIAAMACRDGSAVTKANGAAGPLAQVAMRAPHPVPEAPAVPVTAVAAAELPRDVPVGCGDAFTAPAAGGPTIYADCTETGWTVTGCAIPYGHSFCHRGAWTVVCRADADCPTAMRCADGERVGEIDPAASGYGACARTCTDDAACGRRDMYCDRDDGVCRHRVSDEEEEGEGKDAEAGD